MRASLHAAGGFTLIELVVTMAILITVLTAITGSLVSATNTETDQNNRVQTQTQARLALTKLTREIHCANTIQGLDAGGNAVTLTTTPEPGMVLTLPAGCPTGGASAVTAKWCSVANGNLYDLYRSTSATCSAATGVRWGSALVSSTPFSLPASTQAHALQLIHLNLTVNTRGPNTAVGQYVLADDIAALNAIRS